MTHARTTRSLGTALLVLGLLAAGAVSPALARGEWYDFYEDAIAAIDGGEPRRAIELLEQALSRKAASGYFRTYGNNYMRYAPQFHLGVAWQEAGDCDRALQFFRRSEDAGETEAEPALAVRMHSLRAVCEARIEAEAAPPEPEVVETPPEEPPAAPAPPPIEVDTRALERGLRAYLTGDLDEAIRLFEEVTRDEPRAAQPHALLGAALYGSWLLDGESDEKRLGRARDALSRAAGIDPDLALDPALYPPRVIALYRSLR